MNIAIKILLLILSIDLVFFMVGFGTGSINPDRTFSVKSNFINDAGENYTLSSKPELSLPDSEGPVIKNAGNVFTDTFSTTKSWFLDKTGLGYLLKITGGPYTYLKQTELPVEFVYGIGAIWYLLTLFSIILLISGRL